MGGTFNKPGYNGYAIWIFWLAIASTAYFLIMDWLGAFRASYPFIGVVIELLTIPFLMLAVSCFVLACISWIKARFKLSSLAFYTLVILLGLVLFLAFF